MRKPYLLEGSTPGTVVGCVDASGNMIPINQDSPAGSWCRQFASGGARRKKPKTPSAGYSNFTASEIVAGIKANPLPSLVGAAALGIGANFLAKSPKVKAWIGASKAKKPLMIVAGIVLGAIIGKVVADQIGTTRVAKMPDPKDNMTEADKQESTAATQMV